MGEPLPQAQKDFKFLTFEEERRELLRLRAENQQLLAELTDLREDALRWRRLRPLVRDVIAGHNWQPAAKSQRRCVRCGLWETVASREEACSASAEGVSSPPVLNDLGPEAGAKAG